MTVISGQERNRETDRQIDKIDYERRISNDSYIRTRETETETETDRQKDRIDFERESIMTVISGRERNRDRQTDRQN